MTQTDSARRELRLDELAARVARPGRRPQPLSLDPEEPALGLWADERLDSLGAESDDEDAAELGRILEGAPVPEGRTGESRRLATWLARADALRDWFREREDPPSRRSASADERRLANWRRRQLGLPRDEEHDERRRHLDAVAPGWDRVRPSGALSTLCPFDRDLTPVAQRWWDDARRASAFLQDEGRWPTAVAADRCERAVARWLLHERCVAALMDCESRGTLERLLPGWLDGAAIPAIRGPQERRWCETADQLGEFVRRSGRLPGFHGDDDERRLARWLRSARRTAERRLPSLTPERRALLDERAPGWDAPSDQR